MAGANPLPASIDETEALLQSGDYVADRALATVLFLALRMKRPLFLEGEAGVGRIRSRAFRQPRLHRLPYHARFRRTR